MRCAVYVRVSTDDQRDNGYSIDSQLRMIKEYCEKTIIVLVGYVIKYSVGSITCKLVCNKCFIVPFLTL